MNIAEAEHLARKAIAHHLGLAFEDVHAWHSFSRDLRMHPLDLVLVTLALEDREHLELSLDLLDTLTTVSELAWLLQLGAATRAVTPTRAA